MKKQLFCKTLVIGIIFLFFSVSFGVSFEPLSCDANGPYEGNIMEDIEFDSSVTGGIPPYDYLWDYGDGNTSSGDPHPTHNYANAGNYTVILTVTDSINDTASDTTWAYINAPPDAPSIDGPNKGMPNQKYTFVFNSEDSEGDDVKYYIDWGDGDVEEWIGPYNSESEVTITHTWEKRGNYEIKVKAKDTYDAESDWTELWISIPREKSSRISFFSLLQHLSEIFPILKQILAT